MFCKKCGHQQENGEKFCPVCGTPFPKEDLATVKVQSKAKVAAKEEKLAIQFCKKCGHQQENGEKFCPVCGEPFLDPSGKPYPRGMKKDLLDVQKKVNDKASDLADKGKATAEVVGRSLSEAAHKGKQQFEQKVQPPIVRGNRPTEEY